METIFAATLGTYRDEGYYTHRYVLTKTSLLADATRIRISFQYNGAYPYAIEDVYIGLRAISGNVYDIDPATIVRLQQDGSNNFYITPSTNVSDLVDFVIDRTRDVIISFFGTGRPYTSWSMPSGCVRYYKYTNFAATTAEPGFVTGPGVVGFLTLEGESAITSLSGPIFVTEEADDVSVLSYTWNVGKVEIAESVDEVSGQGFSDVCFINVDEEIDDVAASGWSAVAGIVSVQEELDTIGVTAYSPNIGQIAILEELDTINVISFETGSAIQGIVSVEEYVERLAIVGSNQANKILITENVDEVSVAAITWNIGIVKVREYLDVVSSQMVIGESRGSVAITEVVDSVSSVATTSNVGNVLITCGLDDVGITASTEQLNVGAINITEPADDVSSIAIVCIGATVNITSANDEISGDIASVTHGMISIQDELDVVKINTKIIMPALEFSRPLSGISVVTPALPLGVLHFDRGSITSTSIITAPPIELINFTR